MTATKYDLVWRLQESLMYSADLVPVPVGIAMGIPLCER